MAWWWTNSYSSCVVTIFGRGKLNLCDWNFRSVVSCDWIFSSVVSCVGLGRQIRPEILKPSICCCTMASSFQTSLIIKLKNIINSFTKSVQTFIKNVEKRNISSKCNLTFINIAKHPYWLSIWFYPRKEIISGRF